jgi:hypothetical protein
VQCPGQGAIPASIFEIAAYCGLPLKHSSPASFSWFEDLEEGTLEETSPGIAIAILWNLSPKPEKNFGRA